MCGIDNGFEDREGHQAPFTLRQKKNVQRPRPNFERSNEEEAKALRRLLMRSDLRGNRVEIGPLAGLEFGVNEFTVDANFEGTAAGRDQPGSHARGLTNESRQTGGFRFVISDRAVFDRYFRFHARLLYLSNAIRPRRRCRGRTCFFIQSSFLKA